MAETLWSTVVEQKIGDHWYFFSQQSVKPGESVMTDEQYLAACRKLPDAGQLRISPDPKAGYHLD